MSTKILNQYIESRPNRDLTLDNATLWAGDEIDRLKAELAAAKAEVKLWEKKADEYRQGMMDALPGDD
jgi:hypothetical protein